MSLAPITYKNEPPAQTDLQDPFSAPKEERKTKGRLEQNDGGDDGVANLREMNEKRKSRHGVGGQLPKVKRMLGWLREMGREKTDGQIEKRGTGAKTIEMTTPQVQERGNGTTMREVERSHDGQMRGRLGVMRKQIWQKKTMTMTRRTRFDAGLNDDEGASRRSNDDDEVGSGEGVFRNEEDEKEAGVGGRSEVVDSASIHPDLNGIDQKGDRGGFNCSTYMLLVCQVLRLNFQRAAKIVIGVRNTHGQMSNQIAPSVPDALTSTVHQSSESAAGGIGAIALSNSTGIDLGNQFTSGGITLAILGSSVAAIKVLLDYGFEYWKRRYIVTADFEAKDEPYTWDHPLAHTTTRFTVVTDISKPGEASGSTGSATVPAQDRLSISAFGSRAIIEQLVREAQRKWMEVEKGRTVIFAADQYGNWRRARSRPIRPLSTIVLDRGLKKHIVSDAIEFLRSERWYGDRGIPYRRGYLFYGSPGTGKTSFITALAGHLRFNIYLVSLSNKGLTDDNLVELMSMTPPRCVLLLEDVDAAFRGREATAGTGAGLTFSGLLNAIDGVAAQEGRLLCMTTNHIDHLDPALIRPGRIDVRVLFDKASRWQARELFVNFYGGGDAVPTPPGKDELAGIENEESPQTDAEDSVEECSHGERGSIASLTTATPFTPQSSSLMPTELRRLGDEFASRIPERTFSAAELQVFLMSFKGSPEMAFERVGDFARTRQKPEEAQGTET
ncbi:hypothetical protein HDU93_001951 [Gonapodya sp. JEL0774]|nr:hypothetical protein HDU93_001951 [Gonapodya sp. JEL0774]